MNFRTFQDLREPCSIKLQQLPYLYQLVQLCFRGYRHPSESLSSYSGLYQHMLTICTFQNSVWNVTLFNVTNTADYYTEIGLSRMYTVSQKTCQLWQAVVSWAWNNSDNFQSTVSVHFSKWYACSTFLVPSLLLTLLPFDSCGRNDALWGHSVFVKQSSSFSRKHRTLSLQIRVRQTVRLTKEFVDWCRNVSTLYKHLSNVHDTSRCDQRLEVAPHWHIGKHSTKRHWWSSWSMEQAWG